MTSTEKKESDLQKLLDEEQQLRLVAEGKIKELEKENAALSKDLAVAKLMTPTGKATPEGVKFTKPAPNGKGSDGKGNLIKYVTNANIVEELEADGWKRSK